MKVNAYLIRFDCPSAGKRRWWSETLYKERAYDVCRQLAFDGYRPTLYVGWIDPIGGKFKVRAKLRFRRKCKVYTERQRRAG